jgi:hypothetical protein
MGEAKRKNSFFLAWHQRMTRKHGSATVMWYGHPVGWLHALAMDIYGPNPDRWPPSASNAMRDRAITWEAGDWPEWASRVSP